MKKLFIILLLWLPMSLTFAQIEFPKIFNKGDGIKLPKIKTAQKSFSDALQKFDKKRPISTNFDDAIYEVELLSNFEPLESEYRPLDIQPSTEDGGFRLTSGVYTMTARSFCLRAGTYGPSRGDGHLYAPLKGKQADFVQEILGRYAKHPEIKQQNIQVLLWAIVAGADMNTMDAKYMETLSKLFTPSELLKYKGKDWLNGMFGKELDKLKQQLTGKIAPQLQKIIEADAKIRTTLTQNKTYQEIESIAILAGVAPAEDMIREVSKGRWSYHPNGFFVRYFPRGYKEARIDVYVPFEGSVSLNSQGSVTAINDNTDNSKEVVFNPSATIATPANRSGQRIGISPVPVESKNKFEIAFYAYNMGKKYTDKNGKPQTSISGHIYVGYLINGDLKKVKGFSPDLWENIFDNKPGKVDNFTDEIHLVKYKDDSFKVEVTKKQYYEALTIKKEGYVLVFDDCVSYADDVADHIGLLTPTFVLTPSDFLYPMKYLKYIKENNGGYRH